MGKNQFYSMDGFIMKKINYPHKIVIVGSLKPEKLCQDNDQVLSGGGICKTLRQRDYKDPPRVIVYEK